MARLLQGHTKSEESHRSPQCLDLEASQEVRQVKQFQWAGKAPSGRTRWFSLRSLASLLGCPVGVKHRACRRKEPVCLCPDWNAWLLSSIQPGTVRTAGGRRTVTSHPQPGIRKWSNHRNCRLKDLPWSIAAGGWVGQRGRRGRCLYKGTKQEGSGSLLATDVQNPEKIEQGGWKSGTIIWPWSPTSPRPERHFCLPVHKEQMSFLSEAGSKPQQQLGGSFSLLCVRAASVCHCFGGAPWP